MVSRRWVIAAAACVGIAAIATSYVLNVRGRPNLPRPRSARPVERLPGLRCDEDRMVADSTPADVRRLEADLYAQIVRRHYPKQTPDPLVVEGVSIPVPPLSAGLKPDDWYQALPNELATWLAARRSDECSEQTADRFPEGTFLLPERALVQPSSRMRRPGLDWDRFHERFPNSFALFSFSRAKFTADGRDALLYYDRFCENRCGEGEFVWFHRDDVRGDFHIAKQHTVWVS